MPDFHSVQILDDGPSGNVVLTLDKTGLKDANSRFLLNPMHVVHRIVDGVSSYAWTCLEGVWQLVAVRSIISVTGGASFAAQITYCAGTTAPGSGVNQLTAALDLQETAPNTQIGTLIASPNSIFPGDSLGVAYSGTPGTPEGIINLLVKRTA